MSQAKIKKIRVGVACCGVAAGADAVLELLRSRSESVPVEGTGCLGHCYAEPMVEVVLDGGDSVFYRNVKAENGYIDNILSLGAARLVLKPSPLNSFKTSFSWP